MTGAADSPTGFVVGLALERRCLEHAAARQGLPAPLVAVGPLSAGRAAAAARQLIAAGAGRLISFGLAAGLDPALAAGAAVAADRVTRGGTAALPLDPAWTRALAGLPGVRTASLASVDRPLATAADKAAVLAAAPGSAAADMESWGVAQAAAEAGVPAAVLRVVVDPAHRAVPAAALAGLKPDGRMRIAPVLVGLCRRPGDLAGLAALARDMAAARRALDRLAAAVLATPPPCD